MRAVKVKRLNKGYRTDCLIILPISLFLCVTKLSCPPHSQYGDFIKPPHMQRSAVISSRNSFAFIKCARDCYLNR